MSTPGTETHDAAAPGSDLLERRIADGPRGGAKTWFDVLDVTPDVSVADLQKAYERALSLVDGRSIGGYLMLDPMGAESARADVEAAYAVLGDPERRRAYQERLTETGALRPPSDKAPEATGEARVERAPEATNHTSTQAAAQPATQAPDAVAEPVRVAGWSLEGEPAEDPETLEARAVLGIEPGDASADDRRASHLKFLDPDAAAGAPPAPPRTETPRPGSLDIRFEAPSTDSGPAPALPSAATARGSQPPEPAHLQATGTVSPTAAMPPPTLAPEVPRPSELPEEITGAVIRELREGRGLSLEEVSVQTKVRRGFLQAIEEQDLPNLPARVYLRGFLTQVGRVLKVDRNRLAEGYLRTIEKTQRG